MMKKYLAVIVILFIIQPFVTENASTISVSKLIMGGSYDCSALDVSREEGDDGREIGYYRGGCRLGYWHGWSFSEDQKGNIYVGKHNMGEKDGVLGVYIHTDNDYIYIGGFKNGKMHGNGYFYQDGYLYWGGFVDGKQHGRGLATGLSSWWIGEWIYGEPVYEGKLKECEGDMVKKVGLTFHCDDVGHDLNCVTGLAKEVAMMITVLFRGMARLISFLNMLTCLAYDTFLIRSIRRCQSEKETCNFPQLFRTTLLVPQIRQVAWW